MKLKGWLIVIMVAALLAAYYFLGTDSREQRRTNKALAAQIATAAEQMAQLSPLPVDLEKLQAAALAGLEAELNVYPEDLNTTRIVTGILKLAEAAGVSAVPLVTQPETTASVNGIDFPVFRLNIVVQGKYRQVANFISLLENSGPATLAIEELTLESTADPASTTNATWDDTPVDIRVDLAVYARPELKAGEK